MYLGDLSELRDYNWHGRFVFGSDLPVWQAGDETGLTSRYRAYAKQRLCGKAGFWIRRKKRLPVFFCRAGQIHGPRPIEA